jgi:urease alpha subunit
MTPKTRSVTPVALRSSAAEYLTFLAAGGMGAAQGVQALYADTNAWLTQKMLAALYDVDVRTINYHLKKCLLTKS